MQLTHKLMRNNKILLFAVLILTYNSGFSEDEVNCGIAPLSQFAEKIGRLPEECITNDKTSRDALRKAMISFETGDKKLFNELCSSSKCKHVQISANDEKTAETDSIMAKNKAEFAEETLNSLKKNLGQTMMDLMSLRSTFSLDFDSSKASEACNIDSGLAQQKCSDGSTLEQLLKPVLKGNPFNEIKKSLAYEMDGILTGNSHGDSLLNRTKPLCEVTDNELLHAKRLQIENLISPAFIDNLMKVDLAAYADDLNKKETSTEKKKLKASDVDFFSAAHDTVKPEFVDLVKQLRYHPLLKGILNDKSFRVQFLEKLTKAYKKAGPNSDKKRLHETLLETLYTSENSKSLNKEIAQRCSSAFSKVKQILCSENFKKGNVEFQSEIEFRINKGYSLRSPKSQSIEQVNNDTVELCHLKNVLKNNPTTFTSVNSDLCGHLPAFLKEADFKEYRDKAYSSAYADPQANICKYDKKGSCSPSEIDCDLYQHWKKSKEKGSAEADLLANHDKSIDQILGSFLGAGKDMKGNDPLIAPGVDEETKSRLRLSGIIPNVDGTREESKSTVSTPKAYNERVRTQTTGGGGSGNIANGDRPAPKFKPQDQGKGAAPTTPSDGNLGTDGDGGGASASGGDAKSNGSKGNADTVVTGAQGDANQDKKNILQRIMNGAGKKPKKMRGGNLIDRNSEITNSPTNNGSFVGQNLPVTQVGQNLDQDNFADDYRAENLKNNRGTTTGSTSGGTAGQNSALLKTMYAAEGATGGSSSGSTGTNRTPANEKPNSDSIILPGVDATLPVEAQEEAILAGLEAQSQMLTLVQENQPGQFSIKINSHTITVLKGTNGLYSAVPGKGIPQHYVDALNRKLADLLKRKAEYRGLKGNF